MKRFHKLTHEQYEIAIKWIMEKVSSLLPLKSKNPHPSCKIYKGVCLCGVSTVGETIQNVDTNI